MGSQFCALCQGRNPPARARLVIVLKHRWDLDDEERAPASCRVSRETSHWEYLLVRWVIAHQGDRYYVVRLNDVKKGCVLVQILTTKLMALGLRFIIRVWACFRSFLPRHPKPILAVDLEQLTRELASLTRCSCACGCSYSFSLHEGTNKVELPDGTCVCTTCSLVCLGNDVDVLPLDPW